MSKPKSYIKCPKCGSDAHKIYNKEEIDKAYPNDIRMQVRMKREYICSKTSCSKTFQVSLSQVGKAFRQMRKDEGKTGREIIEELTDEKMIEDMKKRFKEPKEKDE